MKEVKSNQFRTLVVEDWHDFDDCDFGSHDCVYRGQGRASWKLQTGYERQQRVLNPMHEQSMLRRFISQAGIYMHDLPRQDDYVSWFALMQHYGTGTRMLDVTRSRYVALFFALEGMRASHFEESGVVWVFKMHRSDSGFYNALLTPDRERCIDTSEVDLTEPLCEYRTLGCRLGNEFICSDWAGEVRAAINDSFVERHRERMKPFLASGGVVRVIPEKANKRMVAQAAEFLMAITLRKSFEANLLSELKDRHGNRCTPEVVKLIIPKEVARVCYAKLIDMNLTYQTLCPDIEGLALAMNV